MIAGRGLHKQKRSRFMYCKFYYMCVGTLYFNYREVFKLIGCDNNKQML